MITVHMTPRKLRERVAETRDHLDTEQFLTALRYVRDDGRSPPKR